MKCDQARSAMLEASGPVLSGEGDDDLAVHLRGCSACTAVALTVLEAERELDEALEISAATHTVDATLAAVHSRLAREERSSRPVPRDGWRKAAPVLAMAAAVVALALWGDDLIEGTRAGPSGVDVTRLVAATERQQAASPADELAVDAEQRFALMKTDKPTISVVWFY